MHGSYWFPESHDWVAVPYPTTIDDGAVTFNWCGGVGGVRHLNPSMSFTTKLHVASSIPPPSLFGQITINVDQG